MIEQVHYNGYDFQIDPDRPWLRFKGAKSPKTPPAPAPTPTPRGVDDEVEQKARDKRRQRIQAAGRAGTILTDTSQGLGSQSATLLGRST